MSSREEILARLRKNTRETYDMPELSQLKPITFSDPVAEFCQRTTTTAGAKLVEMHEGDDLNQVVQSIVKDLPSSGETGGGCIIASNIEGVEAQLNPDTVGDVRELMKVDVGVIRGCIGVAENACVWVPQLMKEKAVCFASQQLVILLRRADIVNNMHEAYDRIAASKDYFQRYKFATFISGPSKTADIESALVYGAQAARGVTIILQQ